MSEFLMQAVVYLAAAVICVPIAKRLGLSSVLGYLLAGILIGPFVLGFIGDEGEDIMHFAEFGVVMMLFLIGLELEPKTFWRMRKMIGGLGLLQVVITTIIFFGLGMSLGIPWRGSLAAGLALSMSSTAIVLQSLKEKGMTGSASGQSSFAVLLFQDVAIIPILALLPLLATEHVAHGDDHSATLIAGLPAWLQTLSVLGAVLAVIGFGRFVVVPLLRVVAKARLRELFSASALLIVVAIAFLMQSVGLSPALGTFLAGVVLANSEFRHELESDLEPFKGLLLGLFFMAVGASINFALIAAEPGFIAMLVLGIMAIKALVLLGLGKIFGLRTDQNLLFGFGLAQVGEFAFVLLSFIGQLAILEGEWIGKLLAATALTMTLTPLVSLINERLILPKVGTRTEAEKEADVVEEQHKVILVGFSHFGSTLGRFLRANGVNATILDSDSDRVDLLRKMGFKVYYGDATRIDLLKAAGAEEAQFLVSAIDSPETNYELVETCHKHFPNLELIVRAKNRTDAYELMDLGVKSIFRESLDASVRMGVEVLRKLGHRGHSAYRLGQKFIEYDEAALEKLAAQRHDSKQYISSVRAEIEEQEQLLASEIKMPPSDTDHAWDSEEMRAAANKKT